MLLLVSDYKLHFLLDTQKNYEFFEPKINKIGQEIRELYRFEYFGNIGNIEIAVTRICFKFLNFNIFGIRVKIRFE